MVDIIKRIIAEQGEAVLGDPARLKGFVADYASRESKAERLAFGRCIEYGAYGELKNAPDEAARRAAKAVLARRVNANEGLDIALCNDALDALEAALFGEEKPKKARCLTCGGELEAGWVSCPYCGAGSAPAAPAQNAAPPETSAEAPPSAREKSGKKKALRVVLIGAAAVLAIIAARAIVLNPDTALMYLYQLRGRMYEAKGDMAKAYGDFQKAGELGYTDPDYSVTSSLPSLWEGRNIGDAPADIYYCEAASKASVNGDTIEYWLYNTYQFDNGHSRDLLNIIFEELIAADLVFDPDNMEHVSPNTALHGNVKKMMFSNINGSWHDVSVCLYNGSLYINNYDKATYEFDTSIIPFKINEAGNKL
jgi:hypothetical protein